MISFHPWFKFFTKKTFLIRVIVLFSGIFLNSASFAEKKVRQHEAHVHGAAQVALAFDQINGKLEFKGAAESIVGFEHRAQTVKEKTAVNEALQWFEVNIGQMVKLEASLECQFLKDKIEIQSQETGGPKKAHKEEHAHGEHSNFVASFTVRCKKSPLGTALTLDFSHFQKLKDIDITILAEGVQKSVESKGEPVRVDLTPH